ncbi:MAG: hypothetical protein LBN00_04260 [Oscillospiraceae bacterium]|jgi:hypothetical protein|nr:hypothetical protein [Oscillospiraceae bacterium]
MKTAQTAEARINDYPTSYREVKIGRTLYRITSVYKGEKELGPTLERLAVHHVLSEMDGRANEILRA